MIEEFDKIKPDFLIHFHDDFDFYKEGVIGFFICNEKNVIYYKEYHNGQAHCETGPAFVGCFDEVGYWLYDEEYSKEEWEKEVFKIKLSKILKTI